MAVVIQCPYCKGSAYFVDGEIRCQNCKRRGPSKHSRRPSGTEKTPSNQPPFDPYHVWLGIAPADQPANYYQLLGIETFESNSEVIKNAAQRQIGFVREASLGQHASHCQRILNELTGARSCLVDPQRKAAYDQQLIARDPRVTRQSAQPVGAMPTTAQTSNQFNLMRRLEDLDVRLFAVQPSSPV